MAFSLFCSVNRYLATDESLLAAREILMALSRKDVTRELCSQLHHINHSKIKPTHDGATTTLARAALFLV